MHSNFLHQPAWRRTLVLSAGAAVVAVPAVLGAALPASSAPAGGSAHPRITASPPGDGPVLVGRAVLPALTFAGPSESGAEVVPGTGTLNGVSFPLPAQPVEGFSAGDRGRRPGEFLAMEDNGFGNKTNSRDFLTRAYYVRPHFKTAAGGSGAVEVKKHISFRDPHHLMGFPIVKEGTKRRLLTGADIDPESMQRGRHHDLWVGEEFGPWILHFDLHGRLLDPPFPMPDGIRSPDNPQFDPKTATQPSSRGIEGMAISPDGKFLYASLEGATNSDPDQTRRLVFVFSTERKAFTGEVLHYRTEAASNLVADMWALDAHRLVVIERDRGSGVTALFRRRYPVDRGRGGGAASPEEAVPLAPA